MWVTLLSWKFESGIAYGIYILTLSHFMEIINTYVRNVTIVTRIDIFISTQWSYNLVSYLFEGFPYFKLFNKIPRTLNKVFVKAHIVAGLSYLCSHQKLLHEA